MTKVHRHAAHHPHPAPAQHPKHASHHHHGQPAHHGGHGHPKNDHFVGGAQTHTHRGGAGHSSSAAYDAAQSVLGHNIQELKYSGPLARYLDKWPSSHVCCANFVSACLEHAGQISHAEHNDSVRGLASNLGRDARWSRVGSGQMQPGDVVCFSVPGEGSMAHVEMFAGYKNGVAQFIGSNNVNPDHSQRISQGHVGYHIDEVFHFNG
jgi:hypothetical protein